MPSKNKEVAGAVDERMLVTDEVDVHPILIKLIRCQTSDKDKHFAFLLL